jgi:hypothetical protein
VHGTESLDPADPADPAGPGGAGEGSAGEAGGVGVVTPVDLLAEREVWRVEAARGLAAAGSGRGMFELVLDWTDGSWQLVRCAD